MERQRGVPDGYAHGRDDTRRPEALRWVSRPGSSRHHGGVRTPHPQRPAAAAGAPSRPPSARGPLMKFRVERDVLADAAAWVARSLPARPPVPVLGGVLIEATGGADGDRLHGLRVRLRDLGAGRARRDDRRPRPGAGVRPAARRHHPRAAVEAGRPGRRRLPRHDQLRQQPVQPADDAGRGLPAAAGDAAARRHGRRRTSSPRRSRRSRWPPAATTRCRCSPASGWRSRARGSPWPPPTGSGSPSASWTGPRRTPRSRARC